MKKVMLRGNEKYAITEYMPHKFEYDVWYHFVTPFDWQVKIMKLLYRILSTN